MSTLEPWRYDSDAKPVQIGDLVGMTMDHVTGKVGDERMTFAAVGGRTFAFWHEQDCCESCSIEDIAGDLSDLCGSPILMAEEVSSLDGFDGLAEATERFGYAWGSETKKTPPDSYTWTFYKFATVKGYVTVRWFGSSNGYYSESVTFGEVSECS